VRLREQIERDELERLAPWATRALESQGRRVAEPAHRFRTCFQRDRDRVLHAAAFRRLQYKTQVFVYHEGDHFRNRLTHTLEVAQIARTIARSLGCNEDLVEAIVLAHDLGHPPFGHSGETALHELLAADGGFEHNRQSLRIVDWLERRSELYTGLNLTHETRAGILKHGADFPRYGHPVALPELGKSPTTEAQIADRADAIAYLAHDIDDGLRSGLLGEDDLAEVAIWGRARAQAGDPPLRAPVIVSLINTMVSDLIESSAARLAASGARSREDVQALAQPVIGFSPELDPDVKALARFMRRALYRHETVVQMGREGQDVLRALWRVYTEEPERLPAQILSPAPGESPTRAIADYLAGMTDRFALQEQRRLDGADGS
jgi:dGTPase